jgi:hypothetical protein
MGVLATWSAHARPTARPHIDTSGHFPVRVSAESQSNISANPSEVIISILVWNPNIFVSYEPMQYFGTLRQPLLDFSGVTLNHVP